MRKANFAATVKEKTPHVKAAIWLLRANCSNNIGLWTLQICWTGIQCCGIIMYTYHGDSMPLRNRSKPPKIDALREEGTLNPSPDEGHDPRLKENECFDPNDIVQVKD